ncbi:MAG: C4-type zinc ribbon domain-containing protein [bacterium]
MENKLRLLFSLQQIDSSLDELVELKGDLPQIVADLEEKLSAKKSGKKALEAAIKQALMRRDDIDVEVISLKAKIEKYKEQQFQIKTNKQYDALTREIDGAQHTINQLEKEMEIVEGNITNGKKDLNDLLPILDQMSEELVEQKTELEAVNKEHEEEELKLQHQREKIAVRISDHDKRMYERIRKGVGNQAVVPVRRNACGGCFTRVTPQAMVELRKNQKVMTCEHCGRILVSDEIVDTHSTHP